jgi:Asp-tRNA(Asn)/Glu-tRNA(Gln) amidotransferase A subunit family amidase
MARNVPDTALLLSAMASDDADDPLAYTLHARPGARREGAVPPVRQIDLSTLSLAFSEDFGLAPVEETVRAAFREVAAAASKLFRASAEAHPDCTDGDMAFEVLRAGNFLHATGRRCGRARRTSAPTSAPTWRRASATPSRTTPAPPPRRRASTAISSASSRSTTC